MARKRAARMRLIVEEPFESQSSHQAQLSLGLPIGPLIEQSTELFIELAPEEPARPAGEVRRTKASRQNGSIGVVE